MRIPPRGSFQRVGKSIEVYNPNMVCGRIRHAVFDFDGTLSLIRAGWQKVMIAHFVRELEQTPTSESWEELSQVCRGFITRLTGKQTIYQMLQLVEEVSSRRGKHRLASEYKREYLNLFHKAIRPRLDALESKREPPAAYLVRNSIGLLEGLASRDVTCYLASGTDHEFVVDEVGLLGLTPFLEGRIYGAQEDYRLFSKKMLIKRILSENQLQGCELVTFGDGYVEIENTKEVGGLAVGIASLESGVSGWDLWKKKRLLEVGVDILVPDWQEADLLLAYLFGEGNC